MQSLTAELHADGILLPVFLAVIKHMLSLKRYHALPKLIPLRRLSVRDFKLLLLASLGLP